MVHPDILSDLYTSIPSISGSRGLSLKRVPPKQGQKTGPKPVEKSTHFMERKRNCRECWWECWQPAVIFAEGQRFSESKSNSQNSYMWTVAKNKRCCFGEDSGSKDFATVDTQYDKISTAVFFLFRLSWHLLGGHLFNRDMKELFIT